MQLTEQFSRARKLKCIDRELGMRRRVYPGFVDRGKMTQSAADEEIAVMEAIKADYEGQLDLPWVGT
jgi:hypothetical protein